MSDLEEAKKIRRKALEIQEQPSLFDKYFSAPWTDPGFKGIYLLLIYLITVGIGLEALADLVTKGALFEAGLLKNILSELEYVFTVWLCLALYSATYFY